MAKSVAFICQSADVGPALRECRKKGGETILVTISKGLAEKVAQQGGKSRNIQEYAEGGQDQELRKKVVLWMDDWAGGHYGGGKSFKEFLSMDGFSLWWFVLPAIFSDIMRCIQYIDLVHEVIRREAPQKVLLPWVSEVYDFPMHLNRDPNLPGKVVSLTCTAMKIEVERFGTRSTAVRNRMKALWVKLVFAGYNALVKPSIGLLRRGLAGRYRAKYNDLSVPKVAVFSSAVYWRQCLDDMGEIELNDAIAGNCIRELKSRKYDLLGIDTEVNVPRRSLFSAIGQKRKRTDIDWRAIEQFQDRSPIAARRKQRSVISHMKKEWFADDRWRRALDYRGVSLAGLLEGRFGYLFDSYLVEVLGYIEAIDFIAVHERPKLFLIVYEEGPYGRAATIVGQKRGIPTLALQHGTIAGPYLPSYFFHKVSLDLKEDPISCPVPNCTAVFGQRTKDMLTKVSAYPEDSVAIVGMPSYDSAIRALKALGRPGICNTLKVSGEDSIVLVISQLMFNQENRDTYIDIILDAASALEDAQWVVKLHPSESAADWESAISRRQLKGIRIAQGHIQLWLMVCSVTVAWYSTTMLEAALLNKPVCAVYIPRCPNAETYVQDGIAIRVDDSEGLVECLSELRVLESDPGVGAGPPSLSDHIYKPDGNASARVADLVERLIEESHIK